MTVVKLTPHDVDRLAKLAPGRTEELVDKVKTLSDHERRVLMHGIDAINKGSRLGRTLSESVMPIVDKLGVKTDLQWAQIYDEAKDRFWHTKVNEHYTRWKKENPKGTAVEWARPRDPHDQSLLRGIQLSGPV
jgi:hypothetical protein